MARPCGFPEETVKTDAALSANLRRLTAPGALVRSCDPPVARLRAMSLDHPSVPNDLSAFWMPFTANRQFKAAPRMLVSADGMFYTAADGRQVLDGTAGLWCCNAGHRRRRIVEAIKAQAEEMDYAPAFQMGHPKAFEL